MKIREAIIFCKHCGQGFTLYFLTLITGLLNSRLSIYQHCEGGICEYIVIVSLTMLLLTVPEGP